MSRSSQWTWDGIHFGRGVLGPAPVLQRGREQLELLRRRREALLDLAVDLDRRRAVAELGECQRVERLVGAVPRADRAGLAEHAVDSSLMQSSTVDGSTAFSYGWYMSPGTA